MFTGRIPLFYGVKWLVTSQARVFTSTGLSQADVYGTIIFGKEYYGVVDYEALGAEMIVKAPGTVGGVDPLNMQGSVGWKAAIAAVRLDENRCVRVEHASTTGATGG
jgi:N4-gp56 family major capsid protein